MKSNNNGGLLIAGLALAGFMLYSKSPAPKIDEGGIVASIDGIETKKYLINRYTELMGLEKRDGRAYSQTVARLNKLTSQQIIDEAFARGILIVSDNASLRKRIVNNLLRFLGLDDTGHPQMEAQWRKMKLQKLIETGRGYGVDAFTGIAYEDNNFPA